MSKLHAKLTTEYPEYAIALARSRTADIVNLYGRTIFGNECFAKMDTGTLARSCYLQGIVDCAQAIIEGRVKI